MADKSHPVYQGGHKKQDENTLRELSRDLAHERIMTMRVKKFSKFMGVLARLFGKVVIVKDDGYKTVLSYWMGKIWVLSSDKDV